MRICVFSLNKLCLKQSLLRSPWKKVRRLEKSTPTPLQALLTIIRYAHILLKEIKLSFLLAAKSIIHHICMEGWVGIGFWNYLEDPIVVELKLGLS